MCGLAGFVRTCGFDEADAFQIGSCMIDTIAHRGPDGSGIWADPQSGTVLAHRRLAIIDLSKAGHQPMISASGRFVIVFNGEIYNHKELRETLKASNSGYVWRGLSDTETLLACIEEYGIEKTLKKLNGMFAIALFDKREKCVFLARDRAGEKPLYYGKQGKTLYFASELKAIRSHPDFDPVVNRNALSSYLRHNYIPAPLSIYIGIMKLPPGTFVRLDGESSPVSYWSFENVALSQRKNSNANDEKAYISELDDLLGDAVDLQMQADVPLGAFLSGGIDSSLIVALMQERSERRVNSFSIGFDEKFFDEAPFARAVANHIGTDHHELYVSGQQAIDVVPKLPKLYDEPFSDSSQIPTYLVSRMAKEHVTVALSGDAGDELFGGYNRYVWASSIWRRVGPMPYFAKSLLAGMMTTIPASGWSRFFGNLSDFLPAKYRHLNAGDRIHKAANILTKSSPLDIYLHLISHWKNPDQVVIGASEPPGIKEKMDMLDPRMPFEEQMMLLDGLTYLPDDILVKIDRAAMSVSLETRVPFLDHRVIEAAWSMPHELKIRHGVGKWCLRQLLYQRVPKELIERPKTGFGVPLDRWLRVDLRDWAETLISETRLKQSGYFNVKDIRKMWEEHQSGTRNWQYYLWDILMFESWRDSAGA